MDDLTDEQLFDALRVTTLHAMMQWSDALETHRRHPTFHTESNAAELRLGFTCSCTGVEEVWFLHLRDFKQCSVTIREAFRELQRREEARSARLSAKVEKKAKALLHRYLRRDQRTELRAAKSFTVAGQDGRTYRIKEGTCQNVYLVEDGVETTQFCIIPEDSRIPTYDLMLAQKVMIECDLALFLEKAKVREVREVDTDRLAARAREAAIVPNDVEDPGPWAERMLVEAMRQRECA